MNVRKNVATKDTQAIYIAQSTVMHSMLMLGDLMASMSLENFEKQYSEIEFGGISELNYGYKSF